jgi:photosystem II stability/assembly factor-like uncharacterized protein
MHRHALSIPALVLVVVGLVAVACAAPRKTLAELEDPGGPPSTTTTTLRPRSSTTTATTTPDSATTTDSSSGTAGPSWVSAAANLVGLHSECGNLSIVSARPDRDMLIVTVAQQGLWSSQDGATTWSQLGQGTGSATITNRTSSIVYDPEHHDTFWESGIYNGGGVYRTDDNGTTFRQLGDIKHIDGVGVDLTDANRRTLLAGVHESSTLLRSTDGGSSWTDISASLPANVGFVSAPFVVDSQTFLLGTNHGNASGIYRSTDGGATWTAVYQGAVIGKVTMGGGVMYWLLDTGGMIKSGDGGVTWLPAARAGTISVNAPFLVLLPDGTLAAVGGQGVVVSSNQGATWRKVGPNIPFAAAGLVYSPFRHAFYTWQYTCDQNADNPITAENVMSLDITGLK